MTNFEDILNSSLETVEKPRPLPAGTYIGFLEGLPNIDRVGQNKTLMARFRFKITAPGEDIDMDELPPGGCQGKTLFYTLWLQGDDKERTAWEVKRFFTEMMGMDTANKSVSQLLNETTGRQLVANVVLRSTKSDTPELVNDIRSFAPVN